MCSGNTLFAKESKCKFGCSEVGYLGHIIFDQRVKVDYEKIKAMLEWPRPRNIKGLRGFMGLIGYYKRFIKNYGVIASALTALLKKNNFGWNEEAKKAFVELKKAVTLPPVLTLLDFSQPFVVKCDASERGVGAVLMQKGRPVSFFSQALKGKTLVMSTYEKELYALITTVQKWRPYLLGRPFVVRTDNHSLKYLLDHKIGTRMQQKWLSKLLGYDLLVKYKKGPENKVDDALSSVEGEEQVSLALISVPSLEWLEELKKGIEGDSNLKALMLKCQNQELSPHYSIREGIFCKGMIYVANSLDHRKKGFTIPL